MKFGKIELAGLMLVLAGFAVTALVYNQLPEIFPVHWSIHGEANGFASKPWGPFIVPLTGAAIFILFLLLPRISPDGFRMESFLTAYRTIQISVQLFLFVLLLASLLAGIGFAVPIGRVVTTSGGVLLIVLGNLMGKVRKNFHVGIRTPWTLANDEVWSRTHRVGGWLFVLAGLVFAITGLIGRGVLFGVAALVAAAVVPVIYSYVVSRQVQRSDVNTHP